MQDQIKNSHIRKMGTQESYCRNLEHTIKSLEDEIELSIYNYENLLQTEKKNSSERGEFLLYLVQSLRVRHLEELELMSSQVSNSQIERESAQAMQKQMENIGEGVDQIMEESNKLKAQKEELHKELDSQEIRGKELDEDIKELEDELQECRIKIDEWEKMKIKWNRHKKQMVDMIEDAEKAVFIETNRKEQSVCVSENKSFCNQTGEDKEACDHCQKTKIQELYIKYNNPNAQRKMST